MNTREEIEGMLPKKKEVEILDKPYKKRFEATCKEWGYNQALSDTADMLESKVVSVDEVRKVVDIKEMDILFDSMLVATALTKDFIILRKGKSKSWEGIYPPEDNLE